MATAINWVGWAVGVDRLTRVFSSWMRMSPWTALLLTGLGVAILLQSGTPSRRRAYLGAAIAALVGLLSLGFALEWLTGRGFGLDDLWFRQAVQALQEMRLGRPSVRTATSLTMVSAGVALIRARFSWAVPVQLACLGIGSATPIVTMMGHMFRAISVVTITSSTGQGGSTAISSMLLVVAALLARPDRYPVSWLLARPDRWTLIRLVVVLAGLPMLVGIFRLPFLELGLGSDAAWVLGITVATIIVGVAAFYFSQRELRLLMDKEQLSRQRADAEARYRIIADNAADVVLHLRGDDVLWASPSVQVALGYTPAELASKRFGGLIHPEDLGEVVEVTNELEPGKTVLSRFRVRGRDGEYHWVDGHGRLYVGADGKVDGVITALRVVDEQVEAERRLERLARFDTLTGLVNRAEAIVRFEAALEHPRNPGAFLGVLFCDVDHFKTINDTWGHLTGDIVLLTLAQRITQTVRAGDTVGRLGGDELLVLLPGMHNLDEVVMVAEKIRCRAAEPIHLTGATVSATISIGATIAQRGESVYKLMARADVAMYNAKRAGRNNVTRI
jgi:diguanylate cyclase (GGDEF)-like protein/PAS domain S-box-containing protein